jgi:trk system potassium uptake protein
MKIIIIGAGEVGKSLVNNLSLEKNDVTLVEKDENIVKEIATQTDVLVIKGDGTNMSILKDAGIEKADSIIAVTDDDKTNLMISEIALSSNIKKVISIVNTPGNEELFEKIGVQNIISRVNLQITAIKNILEKKEEESEKNFRLLTQLGKGDVEIFEITVSKNSSIIGSDTTLPKAVISLIYRNGEFIMPVKNQQVIKEGDVLVITAKSEDIKELIKKINP